MSIVFTEDRGAVRHVVLNRPEKRNAMNQELLLALREALRAAAADESVHCVILRGEGPVFSAGVDLVELGQSAGRVGVLRPFRQVFLDCANACEEMAKPVICEMRKVCVGGALEVALGCDLRVASSDAQVGLPEVRFGIIPDVGGSTRLPAVVGLGRAKELIMTGRLIGAEEAERIGLVNRVVPAEELSDATRALADELLANSPVAVGRSKRVVDASARPALAHTLELEIAVQEFCVAAAINAAASAVPGESAPAPAGTGASASPEPAPSSPLSVGAGERTPRDEARPLPPKAEPVAVTSSTPDRERAGEAPANGLDSEVAAAPAQPRRRFVTR